MEKFSNENFECQLLVNWSSLRWLPDQPRMNSIINQSTNLLNFYSQAVRIEHIGAMAQEMRTTSLTHYEV